ncbi:hypothetical protein [Rheinheimera sp.]|uniref:hypothetical protein n=1 Tax=Rheinheimera sp. TaxID=1869214 RepID=UPI0027BB1B6D|nr:hypothetical protein [Rheinheimera sp.]
MAPEDTDVKGAEVKAADANGTAAQGAEVINTDKNQKVIQDGANKKAPLRAFRGK